MKTAVVVRQTVEVELGPAMNALSERWRQFCVAYWSNGGDGAAAARSAGFSDKSEGCKVRAHNLLQDPRVRAALKELGEAQFVEMGPMAQRAIRQIASNPQATKQFDAAKYILAQGIGLRETKDVNVTVTRTNAEKVAEITRMAEAMGKDPKEFLGENAIDVEYEDVTEEEY